MVTIKKPQRSFYAAWIILPALCVPAAYVLSFQITKGIVYFVGDFIMVNGVRHITEDYLFIFIFGPLAGLLMGLAQYVLLRRILPPMAWWAPATILGWALGLLLITSLRSTLISFGTAEAYYASATLDVNLLLLGLSIGLCQWLLLRHRLPRAYWWIVANVAGWGLFALIAGNTLGQFGLLVLALLPGCVTAMAMALLLKRVPVPELQSG